MRFNHFRNGSHSMRERRLVFQSTSNAPNSNPQNVPDPEKEEMRKLLEKQSIQIDKQQKQLEALEKKMQQMNTNKDVQRNARMHTQRAARTVRQPHWPRKTPDGQIVSNLPNNARKAFVPRAVQQRYTPEEYARKPAEIARRKAKEYGYTPVSKNKAHPEDGQTFIRYSREKGLYRERYSAATNGWEDVETIMTPEYIAQRAAENEARYQAARKLDAEALSWARDMEADYRRSPGEFNMRLRKARRARLYNTGAGTYNIKESPRVIDARKKKQEELYPVAAPEYAGPSGLVLHARDNRITVDKGDQHMVDGQRVQFWNLKENAYLGSGLVTQTINRDKSVIFLDKPYKNRMPAPGDSFGSDASLRASVRQSQTPSLATSPLKSAPSAPPVLTQAQKNVMSKIPDANHGEFTHFPNGDIQVAKRGYHFIIEPNGTVRPVPPAPLASFKTPLSAPNVTPSVLPRAAGRQPKIPEAYYAGPEASVVAAKNNLVQIKVGNTFAHPGERVHFWRNNEYLGSGVITSAVDATDTVVQIDKPVRGKKIRTGDTAGSDPLLETKGKMEAEANGVLFKLLQDAIPGISSDLKNAGFEAQIDSPDARDGKVIYVISQPFKALFILQSTHTSETNMFGSLEYVRPDTNEQVSVGARIDLLQPQSAAQFLKEQQKQLTDQLWPTLGGKVGMEQQYRAFRALNPNAQRTMVMLLSPSDFTELLPKESLSRVQQAIQDKNNLSDKQLRDLDLDVNEIAKLLPEEEKYLNLFGGNPNARSSFSDIKFEEATAQQVYKMRAILDVIRGILKEKNFSPKPLTPPETPAQRIEKKIATQVESLKQSLNNIREVKYNKNTKKLVFTFKVEVSDKLNLTEIQRIRGITGAESRGVALSLTIDENKFADKNSNSEKAVIEAINNDLQ